VSDSADMVTAPRISRSADDFAVIEKAMMESERGRWFLLEYARRQRAAETQRLLDAIARLERAVGGVDTQPILEAQPPAAVPLPPDAAERARLIAAQLSDIVWNLREAGASHALCDALDGQVALLARIGGRETAVVDASALEITPAFEAEPIQATVLIEERVPVNGIPDAEPIILDEDIVVPVADEPPFVPRRLLAALSRLDELPFAERLAIFA
jgi:hypothetical protein